MIRCLSLFVVREVCSVFVLVLFSMCFFCIVFVSDLLVSLRCFCFCFGCIVQYMVFFFVFYLFWNYCLVCGVFLYYVLDVVFSKWCFFSFIVLCLFRYVLFFLLMLSVVMRVCFVAPMIDRYVSLCLRFCLCLLVCFLILMCCLLWWLCYVRKLLHMWCLACYNILWLLYRASVSFASYLLNNAYSPFFSASLSFSLFVAFFSITLSFNLFLNFTIYSSVYFSVSLSIYSSI